MNLIIVAYFLVSVFFGDSSKMVLVKNKELGYHFLIDTYEVTMSDFEKFVLATGYKTTCEKRGTGPKATEGAEIVLFSGINWRHDQDGNLIAKEWYNKLPVTRVSFADINAFAKWCGKRIPTVKEWKIAAAGGVWPPIYKYSGSNLANKVGWYDLNSKLEVQLVGTLEPNQLGIYDMSGNVEEFALIDINSTAFNRLGGRFFSDKELMRVAENYSFKITDKEFSSPFLGFRLVKDVIH